jgi:hypothetical protein
MLWQAVGHFGLEVVELYATRSHPGTAAANSLGLKPILSLFGF